MEILDINGDGGASSNQSKLSQAELLNLCLIGRVVVNKPIHLPTIEERLGEGPIWKPWKQMDLIQMDNNKFMVQLF